MQRIKDHKHPILTQRRATQSDQEHHLLRELNTERQKKGRAQVLDEERQSIRGQNARKHTDKRINIPR